jgi:hypothetical protein
MSESIGSEENIKVSEKAAKQAAETRSQKIASDAKEMAKFFNEKDAIRQKFAKGFYQSLKDAGINVDPLLSDMKDSLKKHREDILKRKFEGSHR